MNRRDFIRASTIAALTPGLAGRPTSAEESGQARPNVVLILAEDIGPQLGCYGDDLARTPNADKLAATGTRFTRAFTTTPVCSTSRSSLMAGMYATSIGAHNHRTNNPPALADGALPLTHHLKRLGYNTVNLGGGDESISARGREAGPHGAGKIDVNFDAGELFDGANWPERADEQPFFMQITIKESHRGQGWVTAREQPVLTDPERVEVPPYYPDHPVVRDDIANYYDAIALMDSYLGMIIKRIDDEGLRNNTLIVFMGDNGACLVRSKQFLYDGGLNVPLIMSWPGYFEPGSIDERLVTGNDIAPTLLGAAGLNRTPSHMEGQDLFSQAYSEPEHVVGTRDRCDAATDRMRAVRTRRFKYIRNYYPNVPYMQINPYMEREYPVWKLLETLKNTGELTEAQAQFVADRKPIEELYDLERDPHEIHNLAGNEAHLDVLLDMRRRLDDWSLNHGDSGEVMEDPLEIFEGYFESLNLEQVPDNKKEVAERILMGKR